MFTEDVKEGYVKVVEAGAVLVHKILSDQINRTDTE